MKESGQKKLFLKWAKENKVIAEKLWGKTGNSDIIGCARGRYFVMELKDCNSPEKIKPTLIQLQRMLETVRAGGLAFGASLSSGVCHLKIYSVDEFNPEFQMKFDYLTRTTFKDFTDWLFYASEENN